MANTSDPEEQTGVPPFSVFVLGLICVLASGLLALNTESLASWSRPSVASYGEAAWIGPATSNAAWLVIALTLGILGSLLIAVAAQRAMASSRLD